MKIKDVPPKIIIKKLDKIDPKKPKKFFISTSSTSLPIPGSSGLKVNILTNKKDEKTIKTRPKKIFDRNNLKLP